MGYSRNTHAYAMIVAASLLAPSCVGEPTSSSGAMHEPSRASQSVPKSLRAAYITAVQTGASEPYGAVVKGGDLRLENPAQRFVATVDVDGISLEPNDRDWQLAMRTVAVGCAGAMVPMTDASIDVRGNRVELHRDALHEWYVNGPLGVEQGFVLLEPPACDGPKTIQLAASGDIVATLDDADGDGRGEALKFVDIDGRERLSYTDLFVTDATGRALPAWLAMRGEDISIVVDDVGAQYPLTIDPLIWVEQQKLVASDGATGDNFGQSASLSGDTAVVGAFNDDDKGDGSGAAYVFVRNGGVWTEQAKLVASDGATGDNFGQSVSLSGDTVIVGAFNDDDMGEGSGSAYVFVRNGGVWTEQAKLLASDGGAFASFGLSVALSGDMALVGAPYGDGSISSAGAVYAFVRSGGVWTEQAKLSDSAGVSFGEFGASVALSGDTALIGADGDDDNGSYAGAAFVFEHSGGIWTPQQKLLAADGAANDYFGWAVSLSGDTALIGAYGDDDLGGDSGSAYIFERSGGVWTQQAKLVAPDGAPGDVFGVTVSVSGDRALVGAVFDDELGVNSGTGHVFERVGGTWSHYQKLVPSDGSQTDWFTYSVSLSGDTALVGARYDDDKGVDSGSAYVLVLRNSAGDTCVTAAECASGFCVDGVCCDSACGDGDSTDCQACSVAAGAAMDGTCGPAVMGTVCRSAAGTCDAAESCDGAATTCPADAKMAAGTECRAAAGVCDVAESCDGAMNDCPVDAKVAVGTECRAAAGVCDAAESCDGAMNDCPGDAKMAAGTECRAAAGVCDAAESCDGAMNDCPGDAKVAAGTECRAAAGVCDAAESCDGAMNDCPGDAKMAAGTECRAAAGVCDAAESCDGAMNDCPGDAKVAAGTECRAAAGLCDAVESCDGAMDECPADAKVAAGTECRAAAGVCDAVESCDGAMDECPVDAKVAAGTECRAAAGVCDAVESCDGAMDECPVDENAPDGTMCPNGTCIDGACLGEGGAGGAGGAGGGGAGGGGAGGGGAGGAGGVGGAGGGAGGAGGSGGGGIGPEVEGGGCACDMGASTKSTSHAAFFMALAFAIARRRSGAARVR